MGGAETDDVAVAEAVLADDLRAVDHCSVGGVEVNHEVGRLAGPDLGVIAADVAVVDRDGLFH